MNTLKDQLKLLKKHRMFYDNLTDMDVIRIEDKYQFYESFGNVFANDVSVQFLNDIKARIEGELENNVCIFVYGNKGAIKSGGMIALAQMFCPNFNIKDNLVFSNSDLKDKLANSKEGDWFIRDETIMDYGVGSKQLQSDVQMFVETLRKRKNSLIFICPSEQNIPSVDYVLYAFKGNLNLKHKQVNFGMIDPYGSKRFIGGVRIFLNWNDKIWKEYEKVKNEFLEKVVKLDTQSYNVEKDALKIMKHEDFKYCTKKKEVLLFVKEQIPHSTIQYQEDCCTKIFMLHRKMEEESG